MKIPEPNSNEKLTFKLYKKLINGGTTNGITIEPTQSHINDILDNYFLE
jgi:hypothetical protein